MNDGGDATSGTRATRVEITLPQGVVLDAKRRVSVRHAGCAREGSGCEDEHGNRLHRSSTQLIFVGSVPCPLEAKGFSGAVGRSSWRLDLEEIIVMTKGRGAVMLPFLFFGFWGVVRLGN